MFYKSYVKRDTLKERHVTVKLKHGATIHETSAANKPENEVPKAINIRFPENLTEI